ncbi:DUF4258 domain-containing protein [Candidatus Woesearchaeota archaeon]|nr:DUF4258 domain-containing protein [Candidatus Woesearchaeota archaeon]
MRLLITRHARDMMVERGIDEEQIKIAITRGAKFKQTDGTVTVYTYMRIAYKKLSPDYYKIKTVMVEE